MARACGGAGEAPDLVEGCVGVRGCGEGAGVRFAWEGGKAGAGSGLGEEGELGGGFWGRAEDGSEEVEEGRCAKGGHCGGGSRLFGSGWVVEMRSRQDLKIALASLLELQGFQASFGFFPL